MRKTYVYRLYPTTAQAHALDAQLGEACRLYNAALQERRDAYQDHGVSLNYYDQANQLKAIRAAGDCGLANFSASQDVLRRVDKTFKAFFRRVKAGLRSWLSPLQVSETLRQLHLPQLRGWVPAGQAHVCICKASGI